MKRRIARWKLLNHVIFSRIENTFLYYCLRLSYKGLIVKSELFLATICMMLYMAVLPLVFATSPQPPFTESQENAAISSLINTANIHIDEAIQAVQDNNSSEALRFLSELRTDISDINGNVTNLIFTASAQPP